MMDDIGILFSDRYKVILMVTGIDAYKDERFNLKRFGGVHATHWALGNVIFNVWHPVYREISLNIAEMIQENEFIHTLAL